MSITITPKLTAEVHRAIVLGQDHSVSRAAAINLLPQSPLRDSADLLRQVMLSKSEPAPLRQLAALNLWRLNSQNANKYLLEAANSLKQPEILTSVIKVLGRVGDERALRAIEAIQAQATGVLADQASFAASLSPIA